MTGKKISLSAFIIVFLFSFAFAEEYNFAVVYTDSIMGRFEPYENIEKEKVGGLTRLIGTLDGIRERSGGNMIMMSLGNDVVGSNPLSSDTAHLDLVKKIGYDIGTIGINEFDRGEKALRDVYKSLKFPVTASNLKIGKRSYLYGTVKQFRIIKKSGVKIGVFGLVDPALAEESYPASDVKSAYGMAERAQEMERLLREKGRADIVIALVPAGYETAKTVAENTTGIDIICSGGINSAMMPADETVSGKDGKQVIITQAGAGGEYLGLLRLNISKGRITAHKWDPIRIDKSAKENPEIQQKVTEYYSGMKNSIVLARTMQTVDMRKPVVRRQEAPLVSFALDAVRRQFKTDIAMINTGSIRGDRVFSAKSISEGDVSTLFPFGDTVYLMDISGKILKQMLERSVSALPEPKGYFLQVSGIKFEVDARKKPQEQALDIDGNPIGIKFDGARVIRAEVLSPSGKYVRLDENKIYRAALGAFLSGGGDGYIMLRKMSRQDTGVMVKSAFSQELTAKKKVNIVQDGRIKIRY